MIRKIVAFISMFVFLLSLAKTGNAEKYIVGVENSSYPPYSDIIDGQYIGFFREVLDAFAEETGHVFIYKPIPIKRLNRALKGGEIDLRIPDNSNWFIQEKELLSLVYSSELIASRAGLTLLANQSGEKPKEIKKIGTILGFNLIEYQDRINSNEIRIVEHRKLDRVLKMLLAENVDAIYGDYFVFQYYWKRLKERYLAHLKRSYVDVVLPFFSLPEIAFSYQHPYSEHAFRMSTIHEPALIKEFDLWIKENKNLITQLKKKHQLVLSD